MRKQRVLPNWVINTYNNNPNIINDNVKEMKRKQNIKRKIAKNKQQNLNINIKTNNNNNNNNNHGIPNMDRNSNNNSNNNNNNNNKTDDDPPLSNTNNQNNIPNIPQLNTQPTIVIHTNNNGNSKPLPKRKKAPKKPPQPKKKRKKAPKKTKTKKYETIGSGYIGGDTDDEGSLGSLQDFIVGNDTEIIDNDSDEDWVMNSNDLQSNNGSYIISDDDESSPEIKREGTRFVVKLLPLCKYGANCYRQNPQHKLEYAHPWQK